MRSATIPGVILLIACAGCGGGGAGGDAGTDPGPYGTASTIFTNAVVPEGAAAVEERWPDGSQKSKGYHLDGVWVGPFQGWHDNGQLAAEGRYELGVQVGWWHTWHENGQQASECCYVDGTVDTARFWVQRDADGVWLAGSDAPPEPPL